MRSKQRWTSRTAAILGLSIVLGATTAQAAVLSAGVILLQPNKANQKVQLFTTGGDAITGFQLEIQTADGGPQIGGSVVAPRISNVDLVTGTIFAANNSGQSGAGPLSLNPSDTASQAYERYVFVNSGSVAASGLLATVTFDTTGFATLGQSFVVNLTGQQNGNTRFFRTGTAADAITGGTLTIAVAPEPTTLATIVAAGAWIARRRKR